MKNMLDYNEKLYQKRRKVRQRRILRFGLLTISAVVSVALILTKGQILALVGK